MSHVGDTVRNEARCNPHNTRVTTSARAHRFSWTVASLQNGGLSSCGRKMECPELSRTRTPGPSRWIPVARCVNTTMLFGVRQRTVRWCAWRFRTTIPSPRFQIRSIVIGVRQGIVQMVVRCKRRLQRCPQEPSDHPITCALRLVLRCDWTGIGTVNTM